MSIVRKLIRLANITEASKDDENIPKQKMEYLGKDADGVIVFPYGMHANVPAGVLALMFSAMGFPESRFAIPFNTKNRPKLAENELAFFHPPTGSFIKWDENGDLTIDNGSATWAMIGDTVTLTGNLVVNGTMINNGKDVGDTHGHAQGDDSGGNTETNISRPVTTAARPVRAPAAIPAEDST